MNSVTILLNPVEFGVKETSSSNQCFLFYKIGLKIGQYLHHAQRMLRLIFGKIHFNL